LRTGLAKHLLFGSHVKLGPEPGACLSCLFACGFHIFGTTKVTKFCNKHLWVWWSSRKNQHVWSF
jgi:hypothetical protein